MFAFWTPHNKEEQPMAFKDYITMNGLLNEEIKQNGLNKHIENILSYYLITDDVYILISLLPMNVVTIDVKE